MSTNTSEYQKQWYQKNKEKRRQQLKAYTQKRRDANRVFVCEYLSQHPCVDCGEDDIVVLEFDHVGDDKAINVAQAVWEYGIDRLTAEIDKCEVVCANCHRRRTAARSGQFKTTWG